MPKARPRRMPPQRGPRPKGRRPQRPPAIQPLPEQPAPVAVAEVGTVVTLPKSIAVGDLARALDLSVVDVIRGLVNMGVMASINETVDFETATLVANELGIETRAEEEIAPVAEEAAETVEPAGAKQVLWEDVDPTKLKSQLAEHGVTIEEYGGDTPLVPVSARTKQGIEDLVEVVLLVADVNDLKADPDRPAIGRVIEAHLDKGRGPVATVLVQTGTLERGDLVVAGTTFGKVRAMVDDKAKNVGRAEPSRPVEIRGLPEVPAAGDVIRVVADEKAARALVARSARERAGGAGAAPPAAPDEMVGRAGGGGGEGRTVGR